MEQNFLALLGEVFPPISPEVVKALQRARQKAGGVPADLFASQFPDKIVQGDVLDPITFLLRDEHMGAVEDDLPGMLISPSCDYDNDDEVLLAPCYPFERYKHEPYANSITANEITALFYLAPLVGRDALVVDFMSLQRVPKALIADGLRDSRIRRVSSFTDLGYSMLLLKLALQFLRPRSPDEVTRGRSRPPLSHRARYAAGALLGLCRYVVVGR